MKTAIQRGLPFTQPYSFVRSYYTPILEGGGAICENCGRAISNVAVVRGENDKAERHIGMDCAETVTGIAKSLDFEFVAKAAFQAGKAARATILKAIKKAEGTPLKISAKTFAEGQGFYKEAGAGRWLIEYPNGPNNFKQYPAIQWEAHVYPMIKDLLNQ